jgi:hypothetical protein
MKIIFPHHTDIENQVNKLLDSFWLDKHRCFVRFHRNLPPDDIFEDRYNMIYTLLYDFKRFYC